MPGKPHEPGKQHEPSQIGTCAHRTAVPYAPGVSTRIIHSSQSAKTAVATAARAKSRLARASRRRHQTSTCTSPSVRQADAIIAQMIVTQLMAFQWLRVRRTNRHPPAGKFKIVCRLTTCCGFCFAVFGHIARVSCLSLLICNIKLSKCVCLAMRILILISRLPEGMSSGLQCRRGSARCHPDTKMIVIDWEGKHPRFAPLRWKVARLPFSQSRSTTDVSLPRPSPLGTDRSGCASSSAWTVKCHDPIFRKRIFAYNRRS